MLADDDTDARRTHPDALPRGSPFKLIPMLDTAEQAARMVAATRYAPRGVRGVGSAGARSSRWSGVADFLQGADDDICVLVQV